MIKKGKKGRFPSGPVDWWSGPVRPTAFTAGCMGSISGWEIQDLTCCAGAISPQKKFF